MVRKIPIWMTAALALMPVSSFAKNLPFNKHSRAPMLTRAPDFDLSRFHLRSNAGVAWPNKQRRFASGVRLGYDLGSGAFLVASEPRAQGEMARTRAIAIDGGLPAQTHDQTRRPRDANNLAAFGGLATIASEGLPVLAADLGNRLLQIGADQLMRDALMGEDGARATAGPAEKFAESRNAVQQIGDPPPVDEAAAANFATKRGQTSSPPVSAPAGQIPAKDGDAEAPINGGNVIVSSNAPPASSSVGRPLAFDASAGTFLDPLLNTNYDLNFPKVVPSLK